MPLYEYRCKQCGHTFEKIQSFSAPEEKECPQCHGEVERLISAPAIQFKGSGWYVSDYAAKGGAKTGGSAEGKTGEGSSDGGGSSSGTGETAAKPAASSDGSASSSATSPSTTKSE